MAAPPDQSNPADPSHPRHGEPSSASPANEPEDLTPAYRQPHPQAPTPQPPAKESRLPSKKSPSRPIKSSPSQGNTTNSEPLAPQADQATDPAFKQATNPATAPTTVKPAGSPVRLQPEKVEAFANKSKAPNDLLLDDNEKLNADDTVEADFNSQSHSASDRRRDLKHLSIAALVLTALALVSWAIYTSFFRPPLPSPEESNRTYVDIQNRLGATEENEGDIGNPAELDRSIRQLVETFYQAETIDQLLALCRPVPGLKQKMLDHYGDQILDTSPADIADASIESSRIDQGVIYHSIRVTFRNQPTAFIVAGDFNEQMLVDWESAVCWQPISWQELCSGQTSEPYEMRCMLSLDNAFFEPFKFGQHLSFRVTAPGLTSNTYAYIARDSDGLDSLEPAFAFWLKFPKAPKVGIFKLRFQGKASETTFFTLDSMSADSWVAPHSHTPTTTP